MGKSRRKHSREFKLEAVKQVVESGRPVSEAAAGLGLTRSGRPLRARVGLALEALSGIVSV